MTIASTSTWLKGSSYCLPLVQDHSVGVPADRAALLAGHFFCHGTGNGRGSHGQQETTPRYHIRHARISRARWG